MSDRTDSWRYVRAEGLFLSSQNQSALAPVGEKLVSSTPIVKNIRDGLCSTFEPFVRSYSRAPERRGGVLVAKVRLSPLLVIDRRMVNAGSRLVGIKRPKWMFSTESELLPKLKRSEPTKS